jgi:hypothetical protein
MRGIIFLIPKILLLARLLARIMKATSFYKRFVNYARTECSNFYSKLSFGYLTQKLAMKEYIYFQSLVGKIMVSYYEIRIKSESVNAFEQRSSNYEFIDLSLVSGPKFHHE